jgi:hemoglobin-like flavoprotein/ribosomal protein L40E
MGAIQTACCEPAQSDPRFEAEDEPHIKIVVETVFDNIVIDLHRPPVDPSTPLDERDIELQHTYRRVASFGAESVGFDLLTELFVLEPEVKDRFSFVDADDNFEESASLKSLGAKVINALGTVIYYLRDFESLVPQLKSLGLQLKSYGVSAEHYDLARRALLVSLARLLGDLMTPAVENAYQKVYSLLAETMIADHYAEGSIPGCMRSERNPTLNATEKPELTPESQPAAETEPALPTVCGFCSNVFMPDATFCRKCGRRRVQETVLNAPDVCSNCSNIFMPDAVFCRKCGKSRFSDDAEKYAPTSAQPAQAAEGELPPSPDKKAKKRNAKGKSRSRTRTKSKDSKDSEHKLAANSEVVTTQVANATSEAAPKPSTTPEVVRAVTPDSAKKKSADKPKAATMPEVTPEVAANPKRAAAAQAAERRQAEASGGTMEDWRRAKRDRDGV